MVLPTFLYIGASKAGSSWLFEVLREHPEVFVPPSKDVKFFERDDNYERGLDWYGAFFEPGRELPARGELDHDLFLEARTAGRIRDCVPEVKLVVCLREPVDKLLSNYLYFRTIKLDADLSFEAFAFDPETVELADYHANLVPFYDIFDPARILVLFYDELLADPQAFCSRVFGFLGVAETFVPPSLHRKVLAAREPRSVLLAHAAYRVAQVLRGAGKPNLVGSVKRNGIFDRLLYRPLRNKPEIAPEVRGRIRARFAPDYERLGELIGRPVPASW